MSEGVREEQVERPVHMLITALMCGEHMGIPHISLSSEEAEPGSRLPA